MEEICNVEAFKRRLAESGISAVSFDVFDTLLCRPTRRPDHLYTVIGMAAQEHTGIDHVEFARFRRRAENEARVIAKMRGEEEISIDQIYSRFCELLHLPLRIQGTLIELEENTELRCLFVSKYGESLLKAARRARKKIIFLTDTYHSESFIRLALGRLITPRDKLLVSSVEKKTKHSGSLFLQLLGDLSPSYFLHVGDNLGSDIRNALKLGINVFHVNSGNDAARRAAYMLSEKSNDISLSLVQGLLNVKLVSHPQKRTVGERLASIGYNVLGPFWLGFSEFIRATARENNVARVFFLARDGFILQKAYEAVTDEIGEYISVSRHTLYLAYAHVNFEEALPLLLQNYSEAKISKVLERLLPKGDSIEKLNLPRWAYEVLEDKVDSEKSFYDLLRMARILAPRIKVTAKTQFESIKAYFEQLGIEDHGRVAIVDVGWHGSMQVLMQHLLRAMGLRVKIVGLYAGLYEHAKKPIGDDVMKAYLFEYGSEKENERRTKCGPSVIEVLHSAPHGTTIGYQWNTAGQLEPIYAPSEAEEFQYKRFIAHMQKGGLDFLREFKTAKDNVMPAVDVKPNILYAENLLRLVSRPTEEEASFLSVLGLHPDFGPSDEIIYLIEDRGAGDKSMWPIGRSMQYRSRMPSWFNEDQYLDENPSILTAIQLGEYSCGYEHYIKGKSSEASK